MQLILKKLIFFSTTTVQASRIGQICWRLTTLKTSLAHVVLHQQGCVVAFYLAPQHSLDTIHFQIPNTITRTSAARQTGVVK